MGANMPVMPTGDIQTFYRDEGAGDAVVFIHGHTLDHRMWEAQITPLVEAGYRVVCYDLRGHGQTDAPPTGYTPEELAADLKALLDGLGIEQADIVGLSRGGAIALAFALAYPDVTRTVTFIDSILPGRSFDPDLGAFLGQVVGGFRERGRTVYEEEWFQGPIFGGVHRDPALTAQILEMIRGYSAAELSAPPATARVGDGASPRGAPLADRLAEVAAPTLVLVGALDLPSFHRFADELTRGIPNTRAAVIEDAGHMANMEQPAAVNARLLAFLQET